MRPWDFAVTEDGIQQKIATFSEGNAAPRRLADFEPGISPPEVVQSYSAKLSGKLRGTSQAEFDEKEVDRAASAVAGASVSILFDTSNYMYRGFVYAQDAIAEFVRSLDNPNRVAFYSYSRDFSPSRRPHSRPLTGNPGRAFNGSRRRCRALQCAADDFEGCGPDIRQKNGGRFFSNGPDTASMVAPEAVRELAQSQGIPIYMISTREAKLEPVSTAVFERMSASTGGKAYFAKSWQEQQKAFASIRDDLAHLYSLSYYP